MRTTMILACLLCVIAICSGQSTTPEQILRGDLFSRYCPKSRPAFSISDKVVVEIGLMLIRIDDLDYDEGTVGILAWPFMQWKDPRLSWNPMAYGNLSTLIGPNSDFWKPDIYLYNSVDPKQTMSDVNAVLFQDGTVYWIPPSRYTVYCDLNKTKSQQTCKLKFGSWVYNGYQVDLRSNATTVDLTDFTSAGGVSVTSTSVLSEESKYPCCPEKYPTVTFIINFTTSPSAK